MLRSWLRAPWQCQARTRHWPAGRYQEPERSSLSEATSWRAAGLADPGQGAPIPLQRQTPKYPKSLKVTKGQTVLCSHLWPKASQPLAARSDSQKRAGGGKGSLGLPQTLYSSYAFHSTPPLQSRGRKPPPACHSRRRSCPSGLLGQSHGCHVEGDPGRAPWRPGAPLTPPRAWERASRQSRGGGSGSGRKSGACSLYKDTLYKEADGVAGGRVCLPEATKKPEPSRAAVATANKGGYLTRGPGARPRRAEREWSGEEQARNTKGKRLYPLL